MGLSFGLLLDFQREHLQCLPELSKLFWNGISDAMKTVWSAQVRDAFNVRAQVSISLEFPSAISIVERARQSSVDRCRDIYEGNRHRIYSLAFYMTDSELTAEDVMANTFCRAFAQELKPNAEVIDKALVQEVRELMPLGELTLESTPVNEAHQVRRQNTLRADMERAVVQLPPTERMIFLMADVENYDHARIARTLNITEAESRRGLFQARLKLRQLLAAAKQPA